MQKLDTPEKVDPVSWVAYLYLQMKWLIICLHADNGGYFKGKTEAEDLQHGWSKATQCSKQCGGGRGSDAWEETPSGSIGTCLSEGGELKATEREL
jgi:hypothetical protein